MPIPAPQFTGSTTNLVFLLSPETGLLIAGLDYTASGTREDVYDASLGYDTGFAMYNFQLEASLKGKITTNGGTNAISAAAPGAILTLGNTLSLNGITAGGTYCQTVAGSHGEKAFRDATISVLKKPGIA